MVGAFSVSIPQPYTSNRSALLTSAHTYKDLIIIRHQRVCTHRAVNVFVPCDPLAYPNAYFGSHGALFTYDVAEQM